MITSPAGPSHRKTVDLVRAGLVLDEGRAVVLPNAAPLTHVVTAAEPHAVNEAKGRPSGQAVALWAHHPGTLRALDELWDLNAEDIPLAHALLRDEHLTLLAPLRAGADLPHWLVPAAKDGWVLLFGARWEPLRPLLADRPVLYVSSANRTGHPPAATAAEALSMFPASVPVLGLDHLARDGRPTPEVPRRATTTVRLRRGGRLELHRPGAQDAPHPDKDGYLARLRTRHGGTAA
ncbi:hypothetical protein ACIQU5_07940 [Streptomyces sp. NPDC090306]|uniref:hypothetical protein n=1 Tax=unclassified Streptomyces TaxID=2593676 RepID=UPI0036EFC1B9